MTNSASPTWITPPTPPAATTPARARQVPQADSMTRVASMRSERCVRKLVELDEYACDVMIRQYSPCSTTRCGLMAVWKSVVRRVVDRTASTWRDPSTPPRARAAGDVVGAHSVLDVGRVQPAAAQAEPAARSAARLSQTVFSRRKSHGIRSVLCGIGTSPMTTQKPSSNPLWARVLFVARQDCWNETT